jgi:SPP1 gp7 family putative phage head morphogenesis protein
VKIRAALHQVTDFKRVFDKYQETQPQPTDNPTQDRVRARSWILLNIYLNDEPLRQTVMRAWAEAYVLGQVAADEWIKKTKEANKADDIEVNWDNWKPGDKATALLLNPTKGFEAYLQSTGGASYFKKFNKETIVNLGTALSDSIALGLDAESAAVMIGQHVASPSRALTIAITEQNRAMSFSTIERYKEAGLQKMEWAVSDPCDVCAKNDGQVIVIGQTFASGDAQPPAHPHCRCVLLPVIPGMEDEPEMPGVTIITPPPTVDFGPPPPAFPTAREEAERIVAQIHAPKPASLVAYEELDARPFVPGQWTILPRDVVREAAVQNLMRAYSDFMGNPISRLRAEAMLSPVAIKRADKALLDKGIIYKNGPVEVQFASVGLTASKADQLLVLKEVEKLQISNPKTRAVVHIDRNSKGKYGWAYGGKEDLWVTPEVVKNPTLGAAEKGKFKMPATEATTQLQYTLAHEWGHLLDDIVDGEQTFRRSQAIVRFKAEYPDSFKSGYSAKNTKEFYAEMFTEYYRTGGQTPNLLVQAMAREFGWKVPDVPKSQIDYVAARKPATYFTPQKALELEEGIPWRPEGENLYLKKVLDEQGFNGKPRVVSAEEYKKALDSGAMPLHRGVAGDTAEQVDQFVGQLLTGDTPYIGRGLFGDGTYFADSPATALKFAKEDRVGNPIPFGKTVEAALDPRAKIAYLEDIEAEFQRTGLMTPAQKELYYSYPQDFYESASMWATANGYDAIRIKNPVVNWTTREQVPDTYTIVLNRTALIIKEMP